MKHGEGLRGAGATLAGGLSLRLELWDEAAASAYMTGAEASWAARVYRALDLEMASVYVISTCVSSEAVTRECAMRVRVSECKTLRVCVCVSLMVIHIPLRISKIQIAFYAVA